ncbi:MAG: hypothetical protein RRZ69_01290 [Clostridia bacterium]
MKTERFKTVIQLMFLVVAMVFVVMITLGIEFDLTRLKDTRFWVECVCKLIVSLLVFNVVFEIDCQNRRLDDSSRYYAIKLKYRDFIDRLYSEKKYGTFEVALLAKNEKYREETFNKYLHHKGSSRLQMSDFKDIKNIDEVQKICETKLLNAKTTNKVKKVMVKILNGDIKVHEVTVDEILLDKVGTSMNEDGMRFNTHKFKVMQNTTKVWTYLASAIGFTIIQITSIYTGFVNAILTNGFLIMSATVSAMLNSKKFIQLLTNKYDDITRFFQKDVFSEEENENN